MRSVYVIRLLSLFLLCLSKILASVGWSLALTLELLNRLMGYWKWRWLSTVLLCTQHNEKYLVFVSRLRPTNRPVADLIVLWCTQHNEKGTIAPFTYTWEISCISTICILFRLRPTSRPVADNPTWWKRNNCSLYLHMKKILYLYLV